MPSRLSYLQKRIANDPLGHLLSVMNDPKESPARRDRAAIAAAPYVHPRAAPKGQKVRAQEAARKAGGGVWGDDLKSPGNGRPRQ